MLKINDRRTGPLLPLAKSRGFILVTVLGVILLVLVTGRVLNDSAFSFQKEVSEHWSKTKSVRAAENGVVEAEIQIEEAPDNALPPMKTTIDQTIVTSPVKPLVVLGPSIQDFKLIMGEDSLLAQPYQWWDQPSEWWQNFGTTFEQNGQEIFYVLEYVGLNRVGTDLAVPLINNGVARDHIFRVTAKSLGDNNASTVFQTTFVKRFFEEA